MVKTARQLLSLLDRGEKLKLAVVLLLILAMGLVEAVGVVSIFPLLLVLSDENILDKHAAIRGVYDWFGFASLREFQLWLAVAVFCLFMASTLIKLVTTYAITRFNQMRSCSISINVLRGYLHQPYAWYLGQHSADLTTRIVSEVDQVVTSALGPMMRILAQGVVTVAILAALVAVQPMVAVVGATFLGGSYALIYFAVRGYTTRIGQERLKANKARFKIVNEAIGGFKDVKHLGLEDGFLNRFRVQARRLAAYRAQGAVVSKLPRYLLEMVAFGGMLLFVLAMLARDGGGIAAFVPTLGLYALAGARLFPAMQMLYNAANSLNFSSAALKLVIEDFETFRRQTPPDPIDPAAPPLGLRRSLVLEGVRFAYPKADRPALRGVDVEIPALSSVAFVGGTGAGKTTLIDVLLGLLEPQEGRLAVDGVPIDGTNLRAWRKTVGYVPQTIFLTADSVAANIAFGRRPEQVDMAAVERAARAAALHDFVVNELPKGYDTQVGERGVRLSGGQRQRIGIARALYADPDVLIFDEATSALDNLTERAVMEAVASLGGRKTIVMIAHRLSTVRHCDRIFFLRRGRIVASGAYDELIEREPEFRAMAIAAQ